MALEQIDGLSPEASAKLKTLGIEKLMDLRMAGKTPEGRADIAAKSGLPLDDVNRWVDQAVAIRKAEQAAKAAATPEAALQTFFWSMRDHNVGRFLNLLPPKMLADSAKSQTDADHWRQFLDHLTAEMDERMQAFRDSKVVGRQDKSPEQVRLKVQSSASQKTAEIGLIFVGNQWRIEEPFF